jgi:hypothetical protein
MQQFDKRLKAHGVLVNKDEVLAALGHPSGWARDERRMQFEQRLIRGESELDIFGIKGCPGHPGYLDYLRKSAKRPIGSNTGLVSQEANQKILATVAEEVRPEIARYEVLLAELEKRPAAVRKYVADLKRWMEIFRSGIDPHPEDQPIEELQELARQGNKKNWENIELIKKEIVKYGGRAT